MTASSISLLEYLDSVLRQVPPELHPYAYEYLGLAKYHAERYEADQVKRYLALAHDKIVQELRWEAESYETARCYRDAYLKRRQAERYEARHA